MSRGDQRGVYATFSGPIGRRARLWTAVLVCGDGAVLSHESAAELWGLVEGPATDPAGARAARSAGRRDRVIHVTVPSGRTVIPPEGIVVHSSARLRSSRHPVKPRPAPGSRTPSSI